LPVRAVAGAVEDQADGLFIQTMLGQHRGQMGMMVLHRHFDGVSRVIKRVFGG